MTTSSAVRGAWETKVWQHANALAISDKVFNYDAVEEAELDPSEFYSEQKINFFAYVVSRDSRPEVIGQVVYTFTVQVAYYLQSSDQTPGNYNAVVDALEVVDDLVRTSLGVTWNNTVDFYQQTQGIQIEPVTVDDRQCWRGTMRFTATVTV